MSPEELTQCTALMKGYWPSWTPNDASFFAAERQWSDLPYEAVVAALDALSSQGERFAPPPGLVGKEARRLVAKVIGDARPDFDQAFEMIMDRASTVGFNAGLGMEWPHPAVAALVKAIGWQRFCYDTNLPTLCSQARGMYEGISERVEKDEAMPPAGREIVTNLAERLESKRRELEA